MMAKFSCKHFFAACRVSCNILYQIEKYFELLFILRISSVTDLIVDTEYGIFISAGFDDHIDDFLATLNFTEKEYQWVTEQMIAAVNKHSEGLIVFSLGIFHCIYTFYDVYL